MISKLPKHKLNTKVLVIIILLVAFIFRFYNLNNWLSFGMDQEYEALLVKNIVNGIHFPLIGVNASDTGLYLGPAFIYFAALPFILFKGNPIGWGITASLSGILVTFLVYYVGKKMFNAAAGLFAAIFYAGSFLVAFYDRQFWNPMPVEFFSLIIVYLLFKILRWETNKILILSIVFGLAIQTHLSILIFLPLICLVLLKVRKKTSRKLLLSSFALFIILQSPVILFDLRHNFTNAKALVNIIQTKNENGYLKSNIGERSKIFLSALGRFVWVPPKPDLFLESGQCLSLDAQRKYPYMESIVLVSAAILIFCIVNIKKYFKDESLRQKTDQNIALKLILYILLSTFIFTLFYKRQIFEYYYLYLFPWLAIILGWNVYFLYKKIKNVIPVYFILIVFVILNMITLFSADMSFGYKDKIDMLNFVKKNIGNEKYSLEAVGECARFGGYRYVFDRFVGTPAHSYMDSYFSWLYQDKIRKDGGKIVLLSLIDSRDDEKIISKWEEIKLKYISDYSVLTSGRFGYIHVLILQAKKDYEKI